MDLIELEEYVINHLRQRLIDALWPNPYTRPQGVEEWSLIQLIDKIIDELRKC